jgi:hypothetical protein
MMEKCNDRACVYVLNIWWGGPRSGSGLTFRATFRNGYSKMPWEVMKRRAIISLSICMRHGGRTKDATNASRYINELARRLRDIE